MVRDNIVILQAVEIRLIFRRASPWHSDTNQHIGTMGLREDKNVPWEELLFSKHLSNPSCKPLDLLGTAAAAVTGGNPPVMRIGCKTTDLAVNISVG